MANIEAAQRFEVFDHGRTLDPFLSAGDRILGGSRLKRSTWCFLFEGCFVHVNVFKFLESMGTPENVEGFHEGWQALFKENMFLEFTKYLS